MADSLEYETCEKVRPVVKNIEEVIESCACQSKSQGHFPSYDGGKKSLRFSCNSIRGMCLERNTRNQSRNIQGIHTNNRLRREEIMHHCLRSRVRSDEINCLLTVLENHPALQRWLLFLNSLISLSSALPISTNITSFSLFPASASSFCSNG